MGACTFATMGQGKNANDVFQQLRRDAKRDHGNAGYTGTIAEKDEFVEVGRAKNADEAYDMARALINARDSRIDDKWGPAGMIRVGADEFMFFGWASE